jgi:hypothetical protein
MQQRGVGNLIPTFHKPPSKAGTLIKYTPAKQFNKINFQKKTKQKSKKNAVQSNIYPPNKVMHRTSN